MPHFATLPVASQLLMMSDKGAVLVEKQYPIVLKSLYGDWANTFRMFYSFKAEVEKRSPGSVVEIDTEVT